MLAAIRKTQNGYEATYQRILRHPPDKVWKAVSEGKHIAAWFTRNELEPKAGGRYLVHHDHAGLSAEEEVLRYEPPHVFEHTWGKGEWADNVGDTVRWEVHPVDEGTRLTVTYRFRDLDTSPGTLSGWHIWLDVLEAVLDGEPRPDHEPPHGEIKDGEFTTTIPGKGAWKGHDEVMAAYVEHVKTIPAEAR